MDFEWDEDKNLQNQSKHAVSFEDACRIFEVDADYLEIFDEAHSEDEDRFIAVGPAGGKLLVVMHTEPEDGVVRIISARPATQHERAMYRSYMDRYR